MNDTYIPLFRSLLGHRYMLNSAKLHFWIWCLLKAKRFPYRQLVGNQTVDLEIGQFIFGRKQAAAEMGMSEQNIKTLIKFFVDGEQKLTIKSTNKFSIITVIDYISYNIPENQSNQQSNQPLTSNQPASNQQVTTIKKENKEKKKPITTKLDASRIKWDMETNVFIHWWAYCYQLAMARPYVIEWTKDPMFAKSVIEKTGGMKDAIIAGCQLLTDDWHKTKTLGSLCNGYLNARGKIEDRSTTISGWMAKGMLPPLSTDMRTWLTEKINGANNQQ